MKKSMLPRKDVVQRMLAEAREEVEEAVRRKIEAVLRSEIRDATRRKIHAEFPHLTKGMVWRYVDLVEDELAK
jgi:hypothetical protein